MKQTAASPPSNLPAISLGVALLASLTLNVFQLYRADDRFLHYAEAAETTDETAALRIQLAICTRQNARKDSVVAGLKHDTAPAPYTASRNGP